MVSRTVESPCLATRKKSRYLLCKITTIVHSKGVYPLLTGKLSKLRKFWYTQLLNAPPPPPLTLTKVRATIFTKVLFKPRTYIKLEKFFLQEPTEITYKMKLKWVIRRSQLTLQKGCVILANESHSWQQSHNLSTALTYSL